MELPDILDRIILLAKDVVDDLPKRGDSLLTLGAKAFVVFDSVNRIFLTEEEEYEDLLEKIIEESDAQEMVNRHFLKMLYSTGLNRKFKVEKIPLSFTEELQILSHEDLGSLYIKMYVGDPEETFWHSSEFDFDSLLNILWEMFDGRIHIEFRPGVSYARVPEHTDPLLGDAKEMLDRTLLHHEKYLADGLSRTYMFVGIQGTGKSTFALHWAKNTKHRGVLHIDANGMTHLSVTDMKLILWSLKPDFVVVDDVDKSSGMDDCISTLLGLMTELKKLDFPVTMIFTVNNEGILDRALVRPGRVDEVIYFHLPEKEVRQVLIDGYLKEFDAKISKKNLSRLATESTGLSAAYLRELALRCRYWKFDEVLNSVDQMKDLVGYEIDDYEDDEQ